MENVLDNPAWNALISGNNDLSYGNDHVKYFDRDVSPFVAFEENTEENFRMLHDIFPHDGPALFVSTSETNIPDCWTIVRLMSGFQMVYEGAGGLDEGADNLTTLTEDNAPEMLALAKLTNPGPFAIKTINFGHYHGVFENGKLVAMAGQRLHPFNYAEISAVCTHPDYTGKGYARQLLAYQVNRIKAVSETPILHVRNDNERAIKVYEGIGFKLRSEVYFYVLNKKPR